MRFVLKTDSLARSADWQPNVDAPDGTVDEKPPVASNLSMMPALANRLQKPERFDLYVRKFRSICDMHGVQIGSPADLPSFMQKLPEDRFFAMDFWGLIGKLSSREGGELSDEQMLSVIVEGVTGGDTPHDDRELKSSIDDLRAMIAGVDIHNPEQTQVETAPFPARSASPREGLRDMWTRAGEHSPPDSPEAIRPESTDAHADHADELPPATLPPLLDEELLRLELTNLVNQYFANIDKMRSRWKSAPEGRPVASAGSVASPTTRRSLEGLDPEEPGKLILSPKSSPRIFLRPPDESSSTVSSHRRESHDLLTLLPPESHSPLARVGKAAIYLVLVVLWTEAGIALYRHRGPIQQELNALVRNYREMTGQSTTPEITLPPVAETPESTPTPPPIKRATNTPKSAQADSMQPRTFARGFNSRNFRTLSDQPTVRVEQAPVDEITSADLAGAVKVAPDVMQSNLSVSRVPAYPDEARMDRVEGRVTMQVIISKEGAVRNVQVIRGDPRLRTAARNAVYKWQYRPYLVDGQPVDVLTTVTVDFSLDP